MFTRCILCAARAVSATVICLGLLAYFSTAALAAKPPSNEQLFEMVKALQARVVVLEQQNLKYQRKLMEAENGVEPARLQLASLPQEVKSRGANEPRPMRLANPTGGAFQPADNWSGMYWGASFGAGQTVASYSTDAVLDNAVQSGTAGEDTNNGAVVDLFLGLNSQIRSRLIAGLQLEGSLTSLNFNSVSTPVEY